MIRSRSAKTVSLVIPAHNEAELLPRLLDSVEAARSRYRRGPAAVEVVVADNASTDATATLAESRGCLVSAVTPRSIAAARNGGAAAASGAVLAFVDADSRIHPDTFNAIDDSMADRTVIAGATGVRMERWSAGIAATYALLMPLVWLLRMDTGVVFCRRRDFDAVGGYDESVLFGEDVRFLLALRRFGRIDGRRLVRLRRARALASTRKFDAHGDWHYFTELIRLLPAIATRSVRADEVARRYWYDVRPTPERPGVPRDDVD